MPRVSRDATVDVLKAKVTSISLKGEQEKDILHLHLYFLCQTLGGFVERGMERGEGGTQEPGEMKESKYGKHNKKCSNYCIARNCSRHKIFTNFFFTNAGLTLMA